MTTPAVGALTGMIPLVVAGGVASRFARNMSPAEREERRRNFRRRFQQKKRPVLKAKTTKKRAKTPKSTQFKRRKF